MDTYKNIRLSDNEKLVILVRNKMTGEVFEIPADTSSIEHDNKSNIMVDGNENK
ncbi:MAG: hypothetical protein O2809_00590 [Proteobacteria bacterium]|nr:hypothetical protein [Pseudomonadota bacterium]